MGVRIGAGSQWGSGSKALRIRRVYDLYNNFIVTIVRFVAANFPSTFAHVSASTVDGH